MPTHRDSRSQGDCAFARDLFLKREVDQVQIVATRFVNTLTQHPLH
jgi:F0F1-type ATP synthase, gamma subunit